jgi:NAD-dependent dihydropyrimidine dehydrogenase PreA subunit
MPEACPSPPGKLVPLVNRNKCEGKADCVTACPYQVFEVGRISEDDFKGLSLLGKLKSMAHGRKTAFTPRADACQACGKCVDACPERAIRLISADRLKT